MLLWILVLEESRCGHTGVSVDIEPFASLPWFGGGTFSNPAFPVIKICPFLTWTGFCCVVLSFLPCAEVYFTSSVDRNEVNQTAPRTPVAPGSACLKAEGLLPGFGEGL